MDQFNFSNEMLADVFRPTMQDSDLDNPVRYMELLQSAGLFMAEADALDYNKLRLLENLREAFMKLYVVSAGADLAEYTHLQKFVGYDRV